MHTYIYTCVRVYVPRYVTCVCMHVRMYACIHVCLHACMYVRMYVRMHVCMHACTYIGFSKIFWSGSHCTCLFTHHWWKDKHLSMTRHNDGRLDYTEITRFTVVWFLITMSDNSPAESPKARCDSLYYMTASKDKMSKARHDWSFIWKYSLKSVHGWSVVWWTDLHNMKLLFLVSLVATAFGKTRGKTYREHLLH